MVSNYLLCGSGMMLSLESEQAFLFDLKLEEKIKFEFEMDKAPLKNEWIHVKLKLTIGDEFSDMMEDDFREDDIQILRSVQMGIHVLKEKSNTEENVIVTTQNTNRDRRTN